MRKLHKRRVTSYCRGIFSRLLIVAVVLNMSLGGMLGVVVPARAAVLTSVPFYDGFGTGDTDTDVPSWYESNGNGSSSGTGNNTEAVSVDDDDDSVASVSLDGERYAYINGDQGWICRQIDATDFSSLEMSYYWRGDEDVDSGDYGIVEYKIGGDCSDSSEWITLQSHDMSLFAHWNQQSAFSISDLDHSTFWLRFRADSDKSKEDFRVDGVNITGTEDETKADTEAPVFEAVGDITTEANDASGTVLFYSIPTATDNIDTDVEVACEPDTGSLFPISSTEVTCTAQDSSDNVATVSFNVIVKDTTPPEFDWDEVNPLELKVGDSFDPKDGVTAIDNIDGPIGVIGLSGDTVDTSVPGHYVVTYTATDNAGNDAILNRTINVSDVNSPIVNYIGEITVDADGPDGTVVDYGVITATDDVDGEIEATCGPASGSLFPIGTTNVMCTAEDSSHLVSIMTGVTIIVNDTFVRSAEITSPAEDATLAGSVSFDASLTDKDGDDSVQWAVRKGTCSAGTNTVFGNVDGFADSYDWDGATFHAEADTTTWENGDYCFIFNPTESAGDTPIRETRNFSINNIVPDTVAPLVTIESPDDDAVLSGVVDIYGTIDEDVAMGNYNIAIYPGDADFMDFSKRLEQKNVNPSTIFEDENIYQWDTTAYDDGEYLIRFAARDAAGNRDLAGDPYVGGDDSQHVIRVTVDNVADVVEPPVITDETSPEQTTDSVTITWTTDHPATSRVVYDTDSHAVLDVAPNYGYANSTTEDTDLVTSHSVVISGLDEGTTYYFRAVSHGSPEAVSSEVTATTGVTPVVVPPAGGGGGYGSIYIPPKKPTVGLVPVTIGGLNEDTLEVELLFDVTNAAQMAISESPDFAGTSWEPYQDSKWFTLSPENTEHKLYIKFRRDTGGESDVFMVTVTTGTPTGPIQAVLGVKVNRLDELVAKLHFRDRNDEVREMQDLLKEISLFPALQASTGYYWTITLSSVQKYVIGLITESPTVEASVPRLEELISLTKYGEVSDNVRALQDELKKANVLPEMIDSTGYYGPITLAAVQKYQADVK